MSFDIEGFFRDLFRQQEEERRPKPPKREHRDRDDCKKPPLTLLFSFTKGGTTIKGILMDISVHVGNQETFTISGKDASGGAEDVVSTGLAFSSSDPHIANVLADPSEPDGMIVQGLAVGSATGTVTYTNADGAKATATLSITVLAQDVSELDFTQVGGETPIPKTP